MSDEYPRQDLPFTISRRNFFPALLREVIVLFGMTKGGRGFQLSELGNLSDQQLAEVIPVLNPAFEIFVEQNHLWGREVKTGRTIKGFPLQPENISTFNLFNGQNNLGEIGRRVAEEMGWEESRGFAHARSVFLSLARHLVCVPSNLLEQDDLV